MQAPSKLLIVDDLAENLCALEALLRGEGREVYQARSGEQALALLLAHDFALAILDVQMPGMDGFELAELMRGTERTRQIPIVFVSAAGRELNYAFKGYESGAVDFLYKPLDPDAVRGKAKVFIALWEQREQIRRQVAAQQTTMAELNRTQDELRHALRMRDEFMSMVAHELRTPLNTLFLENQMRKLQIGQGNVGNFEPGQWQTMVARDERQIRAMIRLIDDMLDVSRIRSGMMTLRPARTELAGLLRRVVDDIAPQAGGGIALSAPAVVEGSWDAFRIEQVVVNLLTNAVRYGAHAAIEVKLTQDEREVRIEVRDHGAGIAPELQDKIFEPYERAVGNGVPGGLGLGLYISRQLAEAHGGSLRLRSAPGDGATFTLTLPGQPPSAAN